MALAKKPPSGATTEANKPYASPCICIGNTSKLTFDPTNETDRVKERVNTGLGTQVSGGGKGIKYRSSVGQVYHVDCANKAGRKNENNIVHIPPPMKPSQVLFGDKDQNGADINFRPNNTPNVYAMTSFILTHAMGKNNQNNPFNVLTAKNLH